MNRVIWKFSASLAWSVTNPLAASSLLTNQMTSAPMKPVMMPSRWASSAMVRWSCGAAPSGAGGGAVTLSNSLILFPDSVLKVAAPSGPPRRGGYSICAGNGHFTYQNRPGAHVRAQVGLAADRLDPGKHLAQVAGDGQPIHRIRGRTALDPEARRSARIVAGDAIDPLPHQLGHQQAATHAAHDLLQGAGIG